VGRGSGEGHTQGRRLKGANYFCSVYKINKLQGYIAQHREYSQYFITSNGIQSIKTLNILKLI